MTTNTDELLKKAKEVVKQNEMELDKVEGDQSQAQNLRTVEFDGTEIYDIFSDSSMRFEVDPIECYGKETVERFVFGEDK